MKLFPKDFVSNGNQQIFDGLNYARKEWDSLIIHVEITWFISRFNTFRSTIHQSIHGEFGRCQLTTINWRIQSQSLVSNYLLCGDEKNCMKHINDIDKFPSHSCIRQSLHCMSKIIQWLTRWGRIMLTCVCTLRILGPDNGLSPGRC